MKRTMKYKILTAAAALWCLAASVSLANGPVWADRTADLSAIQTIRLCTPEYGPDASVGAEYETLQKHTDKLDDITFTRGFRPTEGDIIAEDGYLIMTVHQTTSEMREEPAYTCQLGLYSGLIVEDGAHYSEWYSPIQIVDHAVGPQRVHTQTVEVEYLLCQAETGKPLFRYRDRMQSERSFEANIEETVTDFYAELKTAVKESKKRQKRRKG